MRQVINELFVRIIIILSWSYLPIQSYVHTPSQLYSKGPCKAIQCKSNSIFLRFRVKMRIKSLPDLSDFETHSHLPPLTSIPVNQHNHHHSTDETLSSPITTTATTTTAITPAKTQLLPGSLAIQKFLALPLVEIMDSALVLLSTFLVAVYTLPSLPYPLAVWDTYIEDIISYLFGLEFLLRWYGVGQLTGRYLVKPLSVIDLLVVIFPLLCSKGLISMTLLPSWLASNSGLVNLRLLRILRLQRVLTDMNTFTQFELSLGLNASDIRPYQLQLAKVVLSIFTLLSVSSGLIYSAEHDVNPNIPDYFTALYFGLTTLTTVGFGDIVPVTFQGRLVVCFSILVGIAVLPLQTAGLVEALLDFQKEREGKRRKPLESDSWNGKGKEYILPREGVVIVEEEEEDSVLSSPTRPLGYHSIKQDTQCVCTKCGTSPHRIDALFCWSCGSKL